MPLSRQCSNDKIPRDHALIAGQLGRSDLLRFEAEAVGLRLGGLQLPRRDLGPRVRVGLQPLDGLVRGLELAFQAGDALDQGVDPLLIVSDDRRHTGALGVEAVVSAES